MAHDRFTYSVVDVENGLFGIKAQAMQDEMNRLGALGWELINVVMIGVTPRMIFKKSH